MRVPGAMLSRPFGVSSSAGTGGGRESMALVTGSMLSRPFLFQKFASSPGAAKAWHPEMLANRATQVINNLDEIIKAIEVFA